MGVELILIYILFFVAMYFFMIRPQQKRNQKQKELRASITVGMTVVTIGGIVGRVVHVSDDEFVLSVGENSEIKFKKWALSSVEGESQ